MEVLGTILCIGIILYGFYSLAKDVSEKGIGGTIAEIIGGIALIGLIWAIG